MSALEKAFTLESPEGFGIYGTLDEKGMVSFVVSAGERSAVRGTDYFNRMMAFFGEDARAILGSWRKSSNHRPSANIDKVNELTGRGVPLEVAIHQTWTVTRAKKLGFTRVRLQEVPIGNPGDYERILVVMEKDHG